MSLPSELIAPISVDLRAEELALEVIKGNEKLMVIDGTLASGVNVAAGDWVLKTTTGFDEIPTGNGQPHVYPVVTGNNQYDALATGNVTAAIGGGFIYRTNKYVAGSYTVGQALTVKDLGAGEMVPSAAGVNDAIVARVYNIDAVKSIMEILVLNR